MLLGTIFDVVIILLIIVSVLLIYSLLMINIEEKTFESGIMRLIGLSKTGYISSIFLQATLFVLPSIFCAFVASVPALYYLYKIMLDSQMNESLLPIPTLDACIIGLFLGICIPAVSSIIPIRQALSKTLSESLNTDRSKNFGVVIEISKDRRVNVLPYLLFGGITVLYGASIYFLLPMSLLTLNISLILGIFFFILIGMIFGLTLLSYNFQWILELLMVKIVLFFELKSMQLLILKNLTAHKLRNQLTAIIYSLTLGCLIFLVVMLNLQISVLFNT